MCVTSVFLYCCADRVLSGNTEEFSLRALSPGVYAMCVKAHTMAGGAESSWVTVTIGKF